MFVFNLIIGIVVGILLVFWLTKRTISNYIVGVIAGVLGSFIGQIILDTHGNLIGNIGTAFLGAICLSILILYIQKLILNATA